MQRFLRPDGVIRIRARYGGLFSLRIDQYIEGVVIDEGYYESEVFEALRPWFTPGAVFWDIGANIGLHAISAALLYPSIETHAFEPSSETFQRLQHHIDGNQVRVRAWPIALGDTDCAGTLHLATDENCGRCTVVPSSDTAGWPTLSIQISRADTLVANGELPAPTIAHGVPAIVRGARAQ